MQVQGRAWTKCEGQGRGGGVEKTLKSHHPVSSIRIYGMLELLPSQAESRKFSSLLCKRLKLSSKHIYISRNLKGNFFQNNSHFLCMYRHRPWFGAINPKDKRVFSVKNNNSNQFDHALCRVSVS